MVLYVIAIAEASDIFVLVGPGDGKVLTDLKKVRDSGNEVNALLLKDRCWQTTSRCNLGFLEQAMLPPRIWWPRRI